MAWVRRAVATAPPLAVSDALPIELPGRSTRPAAVLCAAYDDPETGAAQVILTRRSGRLRTHTGEVSFPGGRLEPGEAAEAAALREAQEEIALDPAAVELVGHLQPLRTLSSAAGITPYVGVLTHPPELLANPAEVDAILLVPLAELWAPGVYREELWPRPDGTVHAVNFFELVGDTVWGATARILRDLLDRLAGAGPTG